MEDLLDRLAIYMEKTEAIKSKIKSALDLVKADGTSGGKNVRHTFSYMVALSRSSGSWVVVINETQGVDQC